MKSENSFDFTLKVYENKLAPVIFMQNLNKNNVLYKIKTKLSFLLNGKLAFQCFISWLIVKHTALVKL